LFSCCEKILFRGRARVSLKGEVRLFRVQFFLRLPTLFLQIEKLVNHQFSVCEKPPLHRAPSRISLHVALWRETESAREQKNKSSGQLFRVRLSSHSAFAKIEKFAKSALLREKMRAATPSSVSGNSNGGGGGNPSAFRKTSFATSPAAVVIPASRTSSRTPQPFSSAGDAGVGRRRSTQTMTCPRVPAVRSRC
jgi:hypothetical protein